MTSAVCKMEPPIRLYFVRRMDAWRSQLYRNRKVGGGYRGLKGRMKDSPFSEPRTRCVELCGQMMTMGRRWLCSLTIPTRGRWKRISNSKASSAT